MDDFETLSLPETGLQFDGEHLTRSDESGQLTFTFSVAQIQSMRFQKTLSKIAVLVVVIGLLVGFVAYRIAEDNLTQVILWVASILITAFGVLAIQSDTIVVTTQAGTVKLDAQEQGDVVQGFVASVSAFLTDKKGYSSM